MTRKPQPKRSAETVVIRMRWGQIVFVARALGFIKWDDYTVQTAMMLRKHLLTEGHVRQIDEGLFEFFRHPAKAKGPESRARRPARTR
jgi:hypothetical protein